MDSMGREASGAFDRISVATGALASPATRPSMIRGTLPAHSACVGANLATKAATADVVTLSTASASLPGASQIGAAHLTPFETSASDETFMSRETRSLALIPLMKAFTVEPRTTTGSVMLTQAFEW